MVAYSVDAIPKWNPINVCSYHLQEAGATPVQEIAYALATAVAVLDAVKARPDVPASAIPRIVGRISFFLNAGIRFVEEVCKVRAMAALWDELARERYGVADETLRRFRYGVQVNSLGLTEAQPENNVIRIVLEALGVTLSKNARCRALQLPAWNEALGPAAALGSAVVAAHPADPRLRDGSARVRGSLRRLARRRGPHARSWRPQRARSSTRVLEIGGVVAAVESAYMKQRLVESHTARTQAIESGEQVVVGVNRFTESRALRPARRRAVVPRGRRLGRARADRAPARLPRAPQPAPT